MLSGKLLCVFLALYFCSTTNAGVMNITVSRGNAVFLPCPSFTNSARVSVVWLMDGVTLCKYFIDSKIPDPPKCGPRFKVNIKPSGLNITSVESSDAGTYRCEMIKVLEPPTDFKNSTHRLQVNVPPSLTLQQTNSSNFSCVELLCSLQGLRPQQVNFTWMTATWLFHHPKTSNSNLISTLTLCKPNWTEGETLSCRANYSHNQTLYSNSITLSCNQVSCEVEKASWLLITVISTCAGLLLLVLLVIAICKCQKRYAANEAAVYHNKIYENFILYNTSINPTPRPQDAQPGTRSNISRTTPQIIRQTQTENSIYEN